MNTPSKSPRYGGELIPLNTDEVNKLFEKLYDKLHICLSNDKMRTKLEKSPKMDFSDSYLNISRSPRSDNGFQDKIDLLKFIKNKIGDIFKNFDNKQQLFDLIMNSLKQKV